MSDENLRERVEAEAEICLAQANHYALILTVEAQRTSEYWRGKAAAFRDVGSRLDALRLSVPAQEPAGQAVSSSAPALIEAALSKLHGALEHDGDTAGYSFLPDDEGREILQELVHEVLREASVSPASAGTKPAAPAQETE